jgi:hypothetical protein
VINPLTTLLVGMAGLDADDARVASMQTDLKSALGLASSINLLTYDPILAATDPRADAQTVSDAVKAQSEAAKIANLIVQGSAVLTGASTVTLSKGDAGRAVVAALADFVAARAAGTQVDLSAAGTINAMRILKNRWQR